MTTLDVVWKKKPEPFAEETAAKELVRLSPGAGLVPDRAGRAAQAVHQERARDRAERGDDRTSGPRETPRPEDRDPTNVCNGTRSKTVLTEATGHVPIDVPRDRDGTFEPQIVRKRQRRLTEVEEISSPSMPRGLTTGEISAHFAEIYGAAVSKETISRITDKVLEEMTEWPNRPLDGVYAAIFIDAIVVKVRDGQVANRRDRRQSGWG